MDSKQLKRAIKYDGNCGRQFPFHQLKMTKLKFCSAIIEKETKNIRNQWNKEEGREGEREGCSMHIC